MAEHSAAHHHTLQKQKFNQEDNSDDDVVPDIFSIIAQESLLDAFHPAFRHLTGVLAAQYPHYFGLFYQYCDEVYLSIDALLQAMCLWKNDCSFSEQFYGIKRKVTVEGWTARLRVLNLLILTGVPYIRNKLQNLYDRLSVQKADGLLESEDILSKLKRKFVTFYPKLYALWSSITAVYIFRFILHKSDIHSPYMKICQTKLVYADSEPDGLDNFWSEFKNHSSIGSKLRFFCYWFLKSAPHLAYQAFSISAFFLQFLQWYTDNQDSLTSIVEGSSKSESIKVAPAPKKPITASNMDMICPICMRTRYNSTALSTSGFVFCYPCIFKYVNKNSKCPVTGYPSTLEHLIKLYMPDL